MNINYNKLEAFYKEIAWLTLNHGEINDTACVTADKLGKALEKVNPLWWSNKHTNIINNDDTNLDEVTPYNFGVFEGCVDSFPVPMEERQNMLKLVVAALKTDDDE